MNLATDLVICKRLSSYEAEKKFGIPRKTILNRCKNRHDKDVGRPTSLTKIEEKHIADVVNISAEFGSPLTMMDLRVVVYNYLRKNYRDNVFNGKRPDETNLSDDPGCSKAIFKRGTKHPERVLNSTKSSVSIMFTGTANGKCLPPYIVYKSNHLWTRWCQNGPVNARYNRTKSGWFDMVCFDDWFKCIV